MEKYPDTAVVQMDLVMGAKEESRATKFEGRFQSVKLFYKTGKSDFNSPCFEKSQKNAFSRTMSAYSSKCATISSVIIV